MDYLKCILFEITEFDTLKKNKVPLTYEERKSVYKEDALWHYADAINPLTGKMERKISAIWKSKNPKTGEITYITHTHRAYNTAPTLKGIISRYHKFIKGTA